MPDLFSILSGVEGLEWIIAACFLSGIVRGFAGFGTAMIFLPVVTRFVDPVAAITTLALMDIVGPLPNVPGAWRAADKPDLRRLCTGMVLAMPVGLFILQFIAPESFRLAVSLLSLAMLAVLISGMKYRGPVTPALTTTVGAVGGFMGGLAGLPGPPVILFYMARPLAAVSIRAVNMLYLLIYDLVLIAVLAVFGRLALEAVVLGLVLVGPGLLGNMLGGRLCIPGYERMYRWAAYGIIAVSALSGLPIWG